MDPKTKRTIKIKSKKGTPPLWGPGSILSPLLANIVLHKLDTYLEKYKEEFELNNIPSKKKGARPNKTYENKLRKEAKYYSPQGHKDSSKDRYYNLESSKHSSKDPIERERRIIYLRYRDDFVVLLTSTRREAQNLRDKISEFLSQECGLTLHPENTTIDSTNKGFSFLGAFFKNPISNEAHFTQKSKNKRVYFQRASTRIFISVPIEKLIDKLRKNGIVRYNYKGILLPRGLTKLIQIDHADILRFYNSKIRGINGFYSYANRSNLAKLF